jgi:hypothetical protein
VLGQVLYGVKLAPIFSATLALLLGATEVGFRLGRRTGEDIGDAARSQFSTVQASVLGLLALLLGFTFSMSVTRFETRRQLVLQESNAIGTAFLRTRLLPEPHKTEAASLLRRYVDVRLAFAGAGTDSVKLRQANEETQRLHDALWVHAVAAGEKDPRAVTTGLFIQSLNEVIDLHAKRVTALESRVPVSIHALLYAASALSLALVGCGWGLTGRRHLLITMTLAVLVAAVVALILDLDRPREGLIRVSQQSMINLREGLKGMAP